MSLALDLKILFGTAPVLIFGERIKEGTVTHARHAMRVAVGVENRAVQQEIS
jgi:hypothetical protein